MAFASLLKAVSKHMCRDEPIKVSFRSNFLAQRRSILVSLSGFKSQFYQSVFKEFMLIAVPSTWTDEQPYQPVGSFELSSPTGVNDEMTQEALISQQNCPGGVTDANPDKTKNSISVNWIAPRHAQGCISFK